MKYRFAIPVSLCIATTGSIGTMGQAQEMKTAKSAAAFAQLSSLVGEWKGVDDGTDFTVTYTLVASGSTLMEEFRPAGGSPMMTMFSVDGDRLLATHYCSALNQPNMSTQAIRDPTAKSIAFTLIRVTGMKSPRDFHNTGLEVFFDDKDHVTQRWTYLYNGKSGTKILHFTRKLA